MTPKQNQFCREYLIDLNSTQAAVRAGYSKRTATKIGSENLTKPDIQAKLLELITQRSERTDVDADRVLGRLVTIANFDPRRLFDEEGNMIQPHQLPEDVAKVVTGIEYGKFGVRIKIADRLKALELLGRHLGMFTDRIETKITEGRVTIYLPDNGRQPTKDGDGIANGN